MNAQPNAIVSSVVANKAIRDKLTRYNTISHQLSLLERKKNALKAELLQETKGADHIMDAKGHEIAAWQRQIRQILDTQRLKNENQSVYDHFLKPTVYTKLTVYFKKQGE